MKAWDGQVLEIILALMLLIDEIHVVSIILNRETGLFYLTVGSELFRWKSPSAVEQQQPTVIVPEAGESGILGIILALLLLIDEVRVASIILNREAGLFYYAIGGELFRWK